MKQTVLITGANSGLGLDAARQFAESGRWQKVVLSARSEAKASAAAERLVELTGKPRDTFGVAIMDLNVSDTVLGAVQTLAADGVQLDGVVLNAGGIPPLTGEGASRILPSGQSELYAMNVGGHALLVHQLVDRGLLAAGATVMLSGSEASRGIPLLFVGAAQLPAGMGELDATLRAVASGAHVGPGYDVMADYGLVKLIGTAWTRYLSETHGVRAITVSPGFTAGTAGMRNIPTVQRLMFTYVALPILRLTGNAHGVAFGAKRYLQALEDTSLESGSFYASDGGGISGPLARQTAERQPLLADAMFTAAVGRLVEEQISTSSGLH